MVLKLTDRVLKRLKVATKGEFEQESSEERRQEGIQLLNFSFLTFMTVSFLLLFNLTGRLDRAQEEYRQLNARYSELLLQYNKMQEE